MSCIKTGCAVDSSKLCLLGTEPPTDCEFANLSELVNEKSSEDSAEDIDAVLDDEKHEFHLGIEMGYSDVLSLSQRRYSYVISILGESHVGKTCLLTSFYIMAIRKKLDKYRFSGSLTLPAFEQRARHARQWEAGIPKSMPSHTNLIDKRNPAFLHLQLMPTDRGPGQNSEQRLDVLFTDLPGEWTTDLMDRDDTKNQFAFLHRSDAILLLLDSKKLTDSSSANNQIRNATNLFERLEKTIGLNQSMPLYLVLAKSDLVDMKVPAAISRVTEAASKHGFVTTTHAIAAWPSNTSAEPGEGVQSLLTELLATQRRPKRTVAPNHLFSSREFQKIRCVE